MQYAVRIKKARMQPAVQRRESMGVMSVMSLWNAGKASMKIMYDFEKIQEILGNDLEEGLRILENSAFTNE